MSALPEIASPWRHELRLVCIALQFLTRVPTPAWVGYQAEWLNQSARHFPLIGALVGAFSAAVLCVALWAWPPIVAALMALAASLWLTGAFHEDGLADTIDALGGAVPREKALQIMKDSRIGSYGAAAMVLSLAGRAVLWAALCAHGPWMATAALVLSATWGRAAAVLLMAWLPYAGDADHAKAKPLARSVGPAEVAWALGWSLATAALVCVVWPPERLLAAGAATALTIIWMRRWLWQRLGGYTGDTLGATEQFAELAILLVLTAQLVTS